MCKVGKMVTHLKLLHTSIHLEMYRVTPKAPVTSAPSDTSRLETPSKHDGWGTFVDSVRTEPPKATSLANVPPDLSKDLLTGLVSPGPRLSGVLRHKSLVANSVLCW